MATGTSTLGSQKAATRPQARRPGVNRVCTSRSVARLARSLAAQNSQFCALMKLAAEIPPKRQRGSARGIYATLVAWQPRLRTQRMVSQSEY